MATTVSGLNDEEWSLILMAYQQLSRDLSRERVLDAIVTAFSTVLGCNRVTVWNFTKGGQFSVVSDKITDASSQLIVSDSRQQIGQPTKMIESVRTTHTALILKCAEDFEKVADPYFAQGMSKQLQWAVCYPFLLEAVAKTPAQALSSEPPNFQGVVYAEKFATTSIPNTIHTNLEKKLQLLCKQCAIVLFHSSMYETALNKEQEPSAPKTDANTAHTPSATTAPKPPHAPAQGTNGIVMPETEPTFPMPAPSGAPALSSPTSPAGTSTSPSVGKDLAAVTTLLAPSVTAPPVQFDTDEGNTILSKLSNQARPKLDPALQETPMVVVPEAQPTPSIPSPLPATIPVSGPSITQHAEEPPTVPVENSADTLLPKLPIEGGPAAQPTKRRSFPKVQFPQPTNPWKVLVIDDDKVNLKIMNNYLANYHCNASLLDNAIDALKMLGVPLTDSQNPSVDVSAYGESLHSVTQEQQHESNKFDIILCDVMMPEMSGYNFCARLREKYPAHELPVIFLTAKNQVADLVEGFNCGGNDFLTKPVSRMELVSRIKLHVNLAKINKAYSRFVPTTFLNLLGKQDILEVKLGDQIETNMTVMFSDIRSFTTISEKMSPQENFEFINQLLGYLGPTVRENGGFIDKFVGDGIMALFPNSARDGLRAAKEILNRLATINQKRQQEGKQQINIGIGLHNGNVMLGCVGEHGRMDGTVIGDVVNLTSRIEDLTKCFGCNILVSHEVVSKLHQEYAPTLPNGCKDDNDMGAYDATMKVHPHRYQGTVLVKGRERKVALYEIFHGDPRHVQSFKLDTKQEFEQAVLLYEKGTSSNNVIDADKVNKAKMIFESIVAKNPGDNGAQYYVETCCDVLELHQLQMASSTVSPSPSPSASPATARLFKYSQSWRRNSNIPPLLPFLGPPSPPSENSIQPHVHSNLYSRSLPHHRPLSSSVNTIPLVDLFSSAPSAASSAASSECTVLSSDTLQQLHTHSVSCDAIVMETKLPDLQLTLASSSTLPSPALPPSASTLPAPSTPATHLEPAPLPPTISPSKDSSTTNTNAATTNSSPLPAPSPAARTALVSTN